MATTTLVDADIKLGEQIFEVLRSDKTLDLRAALWWFDIDRGEWCYVVATGDSDKRGPLASYGRIDRLLGKQHLLETLPLRRIAVLSPNNPMLTSLRRAFGANGQVPKNLMLSNLSIPDLPIDSAYIYYLSPD